MPPHDVYIESHLGGGAVIRNKEPAERNIAIDIDPAVVTNWPSQYYPHVETVLGDAVSYLRSFEFRGSEMVYCDPPYLPATRRRSRVYRYDYSESDHVALIEQLKALPCPVLLSGYDSELYSDLLGNWRKISFTAASHSGARQEVLWLNYAPPLVPHDPRFVGETFREREQVKRRQMRLRSRVESLSHAERTLLASWLVRTYPEAMPGRRER